MSTEQHTAMTPATGFAGTDIVSVFLDEAKFAQLQRAAKVFSSSSLVPDHMRKEPANCIIALAMAWEMRESPLIVMQNIYFIGGKAGWQAQYMIARANKSGVFKSRINWRVEGRGETLSVTAYATLADTGEKVEATVDMRMAKAEGWTRNQKYQTMPETMLRYRSATFLVRWYAPEVMLGYRTTDELEDMAPGPIPVTTTGSEALNAAVGIAPDPDPEPADVPEATDAEFEEAMPDGEPEPEPEPPKRTRKHDSPQADLV